MSGQTRAHPRGRRWRIPPARWRSRCRGSARLAARPRIEGGRDRTAARGPRRTHPAEVDASVVVALPELEPDLEEVRRKGREDDVTPLDQRDGAPVEQLGEPDVVDLLELLEPVDVDVVEGEPALVLARQRERGAGDRIRHSEAA